MAALAETNYSFGYIIKKMPGEWNCQLAYGRRFIPNGKVLHFFGSRIIDTCGRKVPKSMDVFLPKILRRDFYTNLKNKTVQINPDKSIHIDDYYDGVIKNVKEAFLDQEKHVGGFGADIVRSYAFAKSLGFLYKKMPFLVRPLELLGRLL